MKIHHLKSIQPSFDEIISGDKRFELRKNDRDFKAGDVVWFNEYNAIKKAYSGRAVECDIDYVLTDHAGLMEGYCIFTMKATRWTDLKHSEPVEMKVTRAIRESTLLNVGLIVLCVVVFINILLQIFL